LIDSVDFTLAFKQEDPASKRLMAFKTSQLFTLESDLNLNGLYLCFESTDAAIVGPVPIIVELLVCIHVSILRD